MSRADCLPVCFRRPSALSTHEVSLPLPGDFVEFREGQSADLDPPLTALALEGEAPRLPLPDVQAPVCRAFQPPSPSEGLRTLRPTLRSSIARSLTCSPSARIEPLCRCSRCGSRLSSARCARRPTCATHLRDQRSGSAGWPRPRRRSLRSPPPLSFASALLYTHGIGVEVRPTGPTAA